MAETKLAWNLSEREQQILKEMFELVDNIVFWKFIPWIWGVLISMVAFLVLGSWALFTHSKVISDLLREDRGFGEQVLRLLIFMGIIAVAVVFIRFVLKLLIYGRKIRIAQLRLDFRAASLEGRAALEAVPILSRIQKQLPGFPDARKLAELSERYAAKQ